MAGFKEHCSFGFWKASLIMGENNVSSGAMGQFGRITALKDLPPKRVLLGYIKKAMELNDQGIKVLKAKPKAEKKELMVPAYFMAAIRKNKKALATFEAFTYSKKKDYVEWVSEAKSDETRQLRLNTSVAWLAEGKARNWKYEKC